MPTPSLACDKPGSLVTEVRKMLKADIRPQLQIATDLKVPYHWLKSFMAGAIPDPGVNRIQYIYEQLTGRKL
jgi:hypothetical protein